MDTHLKNPLISVIMPVYNAGLYLRTAIESILNQTFSDFEFFIIDDASTDNSVEIIQTYSDKRIKLIVKPVNSGHTKSLNYALQITKGKYIARMDADDFSYPHRFERQILFLESNPNIILCGTWFKMIPMNEVIKHPQDNDDIKLLMLDHNAVAHPSVMLRREFLVEHQLQYDSLMEPAEDYDLWVRIISIGEIANLPEVLLDYRIHSSQISSIQSDKQIKRTAIIQTKLLQNLIPGLTLEANLFNDTSVFELETDHIQTTTLKISFYERLLIENERIGYFSRSAFTDKILQKKKRLLLEYLSNPSSYSFRSFLFNLSNAKLIADVFGKRFFLKNIARCLLPALRKS
jgi:glycosyltransferase involved in cell wall biosynthesis